MSKEIQDFYVQDIEFGSGYNPLQAPLHLAYVAATRGFEPPDPSGAFRYCDLGCGSGVTLNALAAAHPSARFTGIDFNLQHIEQARHIARDAGLDNVEYHEAPFTELESLGLDRFHFIGMNGIYSWLHPAIVGSVIAFLNGHLKANGLFVVGYLTLPGSAPVAPMWNLMRELTSHVKEDTLQRAKKGLELLVKLRRENAHYFTDNPRQAGQIELLHRMSALDDRRLKWMSHAVLADNWHPKTFTEVSQELEGSGLGFVGSALLPLNDLEIAIPSRLLGLFEELDAVQTELLKDFIHNRSQRTDVYIMDAAPNPAAARRFLSERVGLLPRVRREEAVHGLYQLGRHLFVQNKALYTHLVETIGAAWQPLCLGEIVSDPALGEAPENERWQAVSRLIMTGHYQLCLAEAPVVDASETPEHWTLPMDYNRQAVARAAESMEPTTVVAPGGSWSPLVGIEPVLLLAHLEVEAEHRSEFVRKSLAACDGLVPFDGRMTSPEWITPSQLETALHRFRERRLPFLVGLGIVSGR